MLLLLALNLALTPPVPATCTLEGKLFVPPYGRPQ